MKTCYSFLWSVAYEGKDGGLWTDETFEIIENILHARNVRFIPREMFVDSDYYDIMHLTCEKCSKDFPTELEDFFCTKGMNIIFDPGFLKALETQGVPFDLIKKVEPLKYKIFISKKDFEEYINKFVGSAEFIRYKNTIMGFAIWRIAHCSWSEGRTDTCCPFVRYKAYCVKCGDTRTEILRSSNYDCDSMETSCPFCHKGAFEHIKCGDYALTRLQYY